VAGRQASSTPSLRWTIRVAPALLARPALWFTALRQVLVLAPPAWWRRPPHLPLPDAAYLRFRLKTAYGGDGDGPPRAGDLISYLEWCRAWPRIR
jgi:hypothetical protein